MPQDPDTPWQNFDELLTWLNPDRERAISIYLDLRTSLIKIFSWNRCSDPQGLTDEVFDRIARKLPLLKETYKGDPRLYFYGVAKVLIKEYWKELKAYSPVESVEPSGDPMQEFQEEDPDHREECLNTCLQKLTEEKRELILSYYAKEKQAKILHRAKMAKDLGISMEALRVRMLRIREALEECVERCLDERELKDETD